jgi:hypothetical protein
MLLGPFSAIEVETLEELFKLKGVEYQLIVNEQLLKEHESAHGRVFNLGLKFIRFEIADEDFVKVAEEMEKYGIVAPSDGSFELDNED